MFIYLLPGVFGYILGLWAIWPLVPGLPGCARSQLPLIAWVSSWTSPWLATATISAPQNIL